MKIAVIGTGYVGLVSSTCFADTGHSVIGVDINEKIVERLSRGECTIYEPGLEEILSYNLRQKRLRFTTHLSEAVSEAEVIFLALPTPPGADGSADLSFVKKASLDIAKLAKAPKVLVIKSTVPVGTAEIVQGIVREACPDFSIDVVNNPEFLKEGNAVYDFMKPDRIVIGCSTESSRKVMEKLYAPFLRNNHPVFFMDNKSAEMTKYAANCFLATKISFINELANLCDEVGADIESVKRGFTSDYRIDPAFFHPGIGYGGSCFPKDVKALIKTGEQNSVPMKIIQATDDSNQYQKLWPYRKLKAHYNGNLSGKRIAVWGLSFKPKTDDMREAPSIDNILKLIEEGAAVSAFDPVAMEKAKEVLHTGVHYAETRDETLKGADALIVFTEWNAFRSVDPALLAEHLNDRVLVDGRNIFDLTQTKANGLTHYLVGRNSILK